MSLGRDALDWLRNETSLSPPPGWYCVSEVAELKGMTVSSAKAHLDRFLKSGQIKQAKKFKVKNSVKTYYDLIGFDLRETKKSGRV